jgi:hypothetical protein
MPKWDQFFNLQNWVYDSLVGESKLYLGISNSREMKCTRDQQTTCKKTREKERKNQKKKTKKNILLLVEFVWR